MTMSANDDDIDNYFRAITSEGVMAMSANTDDVDSSIGAGGGSSSRSCAANCNFHDSTMMTTDSNDICVEDDER
jgi:hypothetical protein